MKTIKREVKTIDLIEFDAGEFAMIVKEAHEKGWYDEFKNQNTSAMACLNRIMKFDTFNSAELDYITKYFGYERWEHCGYFNDKTNKYRMTVSCTGDITE